MSKNEERKYLTSTIRYDGFSTTKKSGKACATHAYGVAVKAGKLSQGQGLSYMTYDGADIRLPDDETPVALSIIPAFVSLGRVRLPLVATKRGVWYYETATKSFGSLLSAGVVCKLLNLPMPSGDVMAGILLPNGFWTYGVLNWVRKGCNGDFTSAACVYGNRLFVVDSGNRLLYSAPYDYANFTASADDGGELIVADPLDPIRQLVVADKDMYCVAEYGIFRLTGKGAARDFTFQKVPYAGGRIIRGSAAYYGGGLTFLTDECMYFVRDGVVKRLPVALPKGITAIETSEATTTCGEYYYPCEIDGEKRTLCVDVEEGGYSYTQYTPVLCSFDAETYGVDDGGRIFSFRHGCPLENAAFEMKGAPFGKRKDKTVKTLRAFGEGKTKITLSGRNGKTEKTLALTAQGTEMPVAIKGKTFDITISPKIGGVVTAIEADVVQLKR